MELFVSGFFVGCLFVVLVFMAPTLFKGGKGLPQFPTPPMPPTEEEKQEALNKFLDETNKGIHELYN